MNPKLIVNIQLLEQFTSTLWLHPGFIRIFVAAREAVDQLLIISVQHYLIFSSYRSDSNVW